MSDKKNPPRTPSLFDPQEHLTPPPQLEHVPPPEEEDFSPRERRASPRAANEAGKFATLRPTPSKGEWSSSPRTRQELSQELVRRSYMVIPLPTAEIEGEESPALSFVKGPLLAPDLFCIHSKKSDFFCCAQGKGRPAWFRKYARWHHGMDFALVEAYQKIQKLTGKRVSLALQETVSPVSPHQQSALVPSNGSWLFIWLDEAALVGEHMPEWPGGMKQPQRRGRNNLGGWLWPRNAMTKDPFEAQTIGDLLF
jgi:hypothetical protein